MGILIGVERVGHEWPGKRVLDAVTLGINEGERIGIVGKNGDGKSTLLALVGHALEPDEGRVVWKNNISVGMLGQADALDDALSVREAVVGRVPEYEWAARPEARDIIATLVGELDWEGPVGALSGGQRRRADLARLLIGRWDVLLLDEPTNHLDMAAIGWLAAHLKRRWPQGGGALLVITHDRWFLDEVCERMWEVHDGQVEPFEGGYSAYIQQRAERARLAAAREQRRQAILRKELAWLSRGAQARSSKPKFRVEEARALIADEPPARNPVELRRLALGRLGKQVFELDGACVSLGGREVLHNIDWLIGPGDRYGILGENGAGKTTLLRLLAGRVECAAGRVKIGKSVRLGVLSQHIDLLADKHGWRVRELLGRYKKSYVISGKEYTPARLLESLGFETAELDTPIGDLSGGQARRLALMCVLLGEPNVLILDEPGNDLDTDMLAVMEDLLDGWPGTLMLVTHDRYLMERVTDDQFALIDGRLRHCPGGVDEYLRLIARENGAAPARAPEPAREPRAQSEAAVSWKAKKQLASLERKMQTQQGRISELERALGGADPTDYLALEEAQARVDAARAQLSQLEDEWLQLCE